MNARTPYLLGGAAAGVCAAAATGLVQMRDPWVFLPAALGIGALLLVAIPVAALMVRHDDRARSARLDLAAGLAFGVFALALVPAYGLGETARVNIRESLLERRRVIAADLVLEIEDYREHTGGYPETLRDMRGNEIAKAVKGWLWYHAQEDGSGFVLEMEDPLSDEWFSGWTWTREDGWKRWID